MSVPATIDRDGPTAIFRQVAAIIRGRIERGEYRAGKSIPSEPKLAAELGVAPKTLRSALRLLADEGLILTIPNRGSYVVPPKERYANDAT